jgi:hypothetical protein
MEKMKRILNVSFILLLFYQVSFGITSKDFDNLYEALKKDSISLNPNYLITIYTNKSLVNLNLELLRASDRIYQNIIGRKHSWIAYALLLSSNFGLDVAFHEAGHATRFQSQGVGVQFFFSTF